MDKVNGLVQAVGDKFNGSLKVNEKWYSNKKGFKNPAKQGDSVIITLEPWEFKGKTGASIAAVEVLAAPVAAEAIEKVEGKGRDFNSENRGKVRHGLTVALVSLVATDTITLDKLKETVNSLVEFVMVGE